MGDDRHYSGTYAVTSDRVVFDWPNVGSVLTFTFSVDDKGNLALRPIGPWMRGTSSCGRRRSGPRSADTRGRHS